MYRLCVDVEWFRVYFVNWFIIWEDENFRWNGKVEFIAVILNTEELMFLVTISKKILHSQSNL